jgi:prepilin-type processing-associated H-X9-DG protein
MPRIPQRVVSLVLIAVVAVLLIGCGGVQQAAQRQKRANDLKQIGLAYHNYLDDNKQGPSRTEDLQKYLQDAPATYQALLNGQYVVVWGKTIQSMSAGAGTSNTVLGYEADAPTKGGNVLMGDGSVRYMTVQAFQSAGVPAGAQGNAPGSAK